MRNPLHVASALWELAVLGCQTRFRMRGKYWRWRHETAFGRDPARMPAPRERRAAILDYARWVHRMKRLR
ncbi:MAG: hypothetical protein U0575_10405 [Phycisphaerales bacterium]